MMVRPPSIPEKAPRGIKAPAYSGDSAGRMELMSAAELNEAAAALSIPDRTSRTNDPCPRAGTIRLVAPTGRYVVLPTTCKTWRCKACRQRVMALFTMRVEAGCLILGRCAFLTVTYVKGSKRLERAGAVSKDWKELWRKVASSGPNYLALSQWLRVMELTKAGTPHHHLIIGAVPSDVEVNCCPQRMGEPKKAYRARYGRNLVRRFETCLCLAHVVARVWWMVTGDSYIVHTVAVTDAKGSGSYMAKYMTKSFGKERARALGMSRRWSTSKGWPGNGRLQLAQTVGAGWAQVEYLASTVDKKLLGQYRRDGTKVSAVDMLERVGPVGIEEVARKRKYAGIRSKESCFT